MNANFDVLLARLIDVVVRGAKAMLAQNDQTVVNQVTEIMAEDSEKLLLLVLEHRLFMFDELVDDGWEKAEGVWQVLAVVFGLKAYLDQLVQSSALGQDGEAVFVLDEFLEDSAGVQRLVEVISVLRAKRIEEVLYDIFALLLKDLLHLLLVRSKFSLVGLVIAVTLTFVAPGDALFCLLAILWHDVDF